MSSLCMIPPRAHTCTPRAASSIWIWLRLYSSTRLCSMALVARVKQHTEASFFGDSNGSIHLQVDWVPRLSKLAIFVPLPPTTDIQTNCFTPCACVRGNNRYLTVHTSNKPQQIHVWIAWEVLSGPQLWHSGTWSHWLSHTHDYQDCDPKDSQEVL